MNILFMAASWTKLRNVS